MRVLVALVAALACVQAKRFNNPRVVLFDDTADLVSSRAQAMQLCISKGHCIAHDSQINADILDGYTGHHQCGFTWDSQDGKPRHAHCTERDENNHCKAGKSILMNDNCPDQEKFGAYCRVQREGENLPHPCKIHDSDLTEVFRLPGPYWNVPQAKAGCVANGAELAYWSQVSAHVDRYDIQFCEYNIMRVDYAVYKVNCHHDGEIEWQIINNSDEEGYGALCYGQRPHPFKNPCTEDFPTMAGKDVYCDHKGWIIVQDRPPCAEEKNHFSNRRWHEYKEGFGSLDPDSPTYGGYWLGLQPLHQICTDHICQIRFEMFDEEGNFYFAQYNDFELGDENAQLGVHEQYQLKLGKYSPKSTAHDALNEIQTLGGTENESYFSLDQRDADLNPSKNCAQEFNSGWWMSNCHRGNLNGMCDTEPGYSAMLTKSRFWSGVNSCQGCEGLKRTRIKIKVTDDYEEEEEEDD